MEKQRPRHGAGQGERERYRMWSRAMGDLSRPLRRSLQRGEALSTDATLSNDERGRRMLALCQTWQELAATVRALDAPPAAIPAHTPLLAAVLGLADAGEDLAAATASGNEARILMVIERLPETLERTGRLLSDAARHAGEVGREQFVRQVTPLTARAPRGD